MKKSLLAFSLICIVAATLQWSFTLERPLDKIKANSVRNSTQLDAAIKQLKDICSAYANGNATREQLQQRVTKCRLSYKRLEHLLDYYYPIAVKGGINGAPLLHLNPYLPRPVVEQPKGLQVLDELVFADSIDTHHLLFLSEELEKNYSAMHAHFKNHPMLDREVFETTRLQLIRIFTMGISGFDTPGSLHGLQESTVSLQALQEAMKHYYSLVPKHQNHICENVEESFTEAITYLQTHTDFDSFDRLHFLRKFINPLYRDILLLHEATGIETVKEVTNRLQSVNYYAENIFDPDFLDPYFYSTLTPQEDNPALNSLGRKLFYDKSLSANGNLSCASCHDPQKAFSDGEITSIGSDGSRLYRNAPGLFNAAYTRSFFSDMRAQRFEDQIEHVLFNHQEFGTSYPELFAKLETRDDYSELFKAAFPHFDRNLINRTNFSLALSSYLIDLTSFNSPFDTYARGENDDLSEEARKGFNLFMGKAACGTCHFAPTFAGLVPPVYQDSESEVLGVLTAPESGILDEDRGRAANGIPMESDVYFYEYSFKTPTVRNVALTSPYFHHGTYETLEQVLTFYNHGGGAGIGLNLSHQTLPSDSLYLSQDEIDAIIAFMNSLTDTSSYKLNLSEAFTHY